MKLQDVGRSNLPDYDFDRKGPTLFPDEGSATDLGEDGELPEESF
jgi:hypothetical protein